MLANLNTFVASYVPAYAWDVLQFILGMTCATLAFISRGWSTKIQTGSIHCNVKWTTVRIGQVSNWAKLALSLFMAFDALAPGPAPARTIMLTWVLVVIGGQIASVHTGWERQQRRQQGNVAYQGD